ncbi:HMG high mobility group box-containing protein [Nitzschia inconspicua]|uniref:HMG high mobility group box-containing protein n=1 Tax=Nitzschia inconspicua TaxID=303405 RepID=A0A9K3L6Q9_9STRA|nr:HMG high mobility group box-containing protein [Nitzschia inconspicua]
MHSASWDSFQKANNRSRSENSDNNNIFNLFADTTIGDNKYSSKSCTSQSNHLLVGGASPPPIITPTSSTLHTAAPPPPWSFTVPSKNPSGTDILSRNTAPRTPITQPTTRSTLNPISLMDLPKPVDWASDAEGAPLETSSNLEEQHSSNRHSRVLPGGEDDPVEKQGTKEQVKHKRKRRPPAVPWKKPKDMPRRPLSAYNLFFKERREAMMAAAKETETSQSTPSFGRRKSNKSVGIGFANLARTIATEWKILDPNTKAPYESRAAADKSRYDKEMLVWRAKQKEDKASAAALAKPQSERMSPSNAAGGSMHMTFPAPTTDGTNDSISIQFPPSLPASSRMHASNAAQISFQIPSMTMDGMMMMGQQNPLQQQRQAMMNWTELHSPMSLSSDAVESSRVPHGLGMQMSGLSNEAIQSMPTANLQVAGFRQQQQLDPTQFNRRLQMMWEQNQNMASGDGNAHLLEGTTSNATSDSMIASFGNFEEYNQYLSQTSADRFASSQQNASMPSFIGTNSESMRRGQIMDHPSLFVESRNTWSGMPKAQEDALHHMHMNQLRQEEEILKEQLREHRRRYMEHEHQLHQERQQQIREGGRFFVGSGNIEPMAAQYLSQRADAWTEMQPASGPSDIHLNTAPVGPQTPMQQQPSQLSSTDHYPSTWFEADSDVGGIGNRTDESLSQYIPGADGELNQKLPGKSTTNAMTLTFGGQQGGHDLKKGTKTEVDPWNPIELKEPQSGFGGDNEPQWHPTPLRYQHRLEETKMGGSNAAGVQHPGLNIGSRGEASSGQSLGIGLDDETAAFMSQFRFGGGLNTPDGSPDTGGGS